MRRAWWWIIAVGQVACVEDSPVAESWNAVFRVESFRRDPGCDPATTETEPLQPFVATGYSADPEIDLEVVTLFWCPTETQCIDLPQANAWLDVAEVGEVSGSFGEAELVAAGLCNGFYNEIQATQTPGGQLSLDVLLATLEPQVVGSEDECRELLDDVATTGCDERLAIEARRID